MSINAKVKQMKQLYQNLEVIQDEQGSIVGMFLTLNAQLKLRWRAAKPTIWDIWNPDRKVAIEVTSSKVPVELQRTAQGFIGDWNSLDENKEEIKETVKVIPAEIREEVKGNFRIIPEEVMEAVFEEAGSQKHVETPEPTIKKEEPKKAVCKSSPVSSPATIKTNAILENMRNKQIGELTARDIQSYLAPKASEVEATIFLKLCQAKGLNPFLKEAYIIKYSDNVPASFVIGKDGFATKAENHPMYDGYEAGIIVRCPVDGSTSVLERRVGTFRLENEALLGGWCKVWRKDRRNPLTIEVTLSEYLQYDRDHKINTFWSKMPATMIRKVAFSQAHRESFPGEFSGLYDAAELAGPVIDAVYTQFEEMEE